MLLQATARAVTAKATDLCVLVAARLGIHTTPTISANVPKRARCEFGAKSASRRKTTAPARAFDCVMPPAYGGRHCLPRRFTQAGGTTNAAHANPVRSEASDGANTHPAPPKVSSVRPRERTPCGASLVFTLTVAEVG
jgi:hypothetical protein